MGIIWWAGSNAGEGVATASAWHGGATGRDNTLAGLSFYQGGVSTNPNHKGKVYGAGSHNALGCFRRQSDV